MPFIDCDHVIKQVAASASTMRPSPLPKSTAACAYSSDEIASASIILYSKYGLEVPA